MTLTETIDAAGEPYPGLRSFQHNETHIFFGREGTISEMVDRLAAHRFLAVTGLSGSGKSSLVRTGLLNALERGLLVEAGSDWRFVDFRPGGWPLSPMVAALVAGLGLKFSDNEIGLIEAKLARGPLGLVEWLDEVGFSRETNLLLLVDQFEEIFRYRHGASGDDINAFVALLLASAKQRRQRIYVVITMRSDYLGDCARFTDLAETINDGQFLTPQLTREQCREAIEGPAAVYDGKVEPALVTRMLNDMAGNPDQLPLMQHILMLMWKQAQERDPHHPPQLTLADYENLGGIGSSGADGDAADGSGTKASLRRRLAAAVRGRFAGKPKSQDAEGAKPSRRSNGALSDHADRVLAELTPAQQRLAAIVFRALTQSEGTGGRDVRRPTKLKDLAAVAELQAAADLVPVIEAFRGRGRHFLTPPAPVPLEPNTDIDITHESLIRQWATLRRWVREEYQSAEEYRGIERAAKHWREGRGSLLMKVDLAVAKKWRKTERPNKSWAARYGDAFLLAMQFIQKSNWAQRRRRVLTFGLPIAGLCILVYLDVFLALALPYIDPAGEFTDYHLKPQAVLQASNRIGTNTPTAIPGGRVISTLALKAALQSGTIGGAPFKLLDEWNSDHTPIPGATTQYQYAAASGSFNDAVQQKLAADLKSLTGGNLNMPLVFYCVGSQCWESYNAALRAIYLGYNNVYWYRGGLVAWYEVNAALDLRAVGLVRLPIWSGLSSAGSKAGNFFLYVFLPMFGYERQNDIGQQAVAPAGKKAASAADYIKLGESLAGAKTPDYGDAIADYSKAITLDPKNQQAYYDRGLAYAREGDADDAIADDSKAIALGDNDAVVFYNRAEAYFHRHSYDDAIKDYTQAIARNAKSALYFVGRGGAYYNKGDDDDAITDYNAALQLSPKSALYFNERGNAYYARAVGYYNRGQTFYASAKAQFESSIQDYAQSIGLDATDYVYFSNRGNAYVYLSEVDSANESASLDNAGNDFAQALKLNPKYAWPYYGEGRIAYRRQDFAGAVKDFTGAIGLDSSFAQAYEARGDAYRRQNDDPHAIADYGAAIKLESDYAAAFFGRGEAYFDQKNYNSAALDLMHAINLEPDNADYYWDLGFAHLYGNKPGSAADDIAQATQRSSYSYVAIWLHIARMRAGENDTSEFAGNTQKMDHSQWPWPVVALFLGTMTPDAVAAAAQSANDTTTRSGQVCEADFYTGIYQAASGNKSAAQPLLQAAAAACPADYLERKMAPLELTRLQ
ncbi:MAG: tetratricopeptide repeat protein [Xanthobacteraceae bacterium]